MFENLDAKSCILVTGQEVGGTNTLLVPNLKFGGPVSPGPYGCCAWGVVSFSG